MTSEQTPPPDSPAQEPTDPTMLEPLLVRVEEAARLLSFSRATIYAMLDSGELPSVRRGTARRIPATALRAWGERRVARDTPGSGG